MEVAAGYRRPKKGIRGRRARRGGGGGHRRVENNESVERESIEAETSFALSALNASGSRKVNLFAENVIKSPPPSLGWLSRARTRTPPPPHVYLRLTNTKGHPRERMENSREIVRAGERERERSDESKPARGREIERKRGERLE